MGQFRENDPNSGRTKVDEYCQFLQIKLFHDTTQLHSSDDEVEPNEEEGEQQIEIVSDKMEKELSMVDLLQSSKCKIEQKIFLINDGNNHTEKRYV